MTRPLAATGNLLTTNYLLIMLTASQFMSLALYSPEYGYYRRNVSQWGFEGKDYYTALDLGPLLGETLAVRLYQVWQQLDRPAVFTVLEPGAGRGWLGRDLLTAITGDFAQSLHYIHCDDNPLAQKEAQTALDPWLNSGRAAFIAQNEQIPYFTGAVISNELFDALPAQPWRWDGQQWNRQILVSNQSTTDDNKEVTSYPKGPCRAKRPCGKDALRGQLPKGPLRPVTRITNEVPRDDNVATPYELRTTNYELRTTNYELSPEWRPADPLEAGQWFSKHAEGGLQPEDGSIWSESLPDVLRHICRPLQKGIFLAIDYGDTAPRLLAKGAGLRRYHKHTVDNDWWTDPGNSDITADVDFTRLASLLEQQGLEPRPLSTLARWICTHAPLAQLEEHWRELPPKERAARAQNLSQLTLPNAMGERFKVLEALKAVSS